MGAILSPEMLQADAVMGLIVHFLKSFFLFLSISTEVGYISADKFVSVFAVGSPGRSSSHEQPVA